MTPTLPNAPTSAAGDDIDPRLLHETQAYLEGRWQGRTDRGPLIAAWERFYRTYDPIIRRFAVACVPLPADLDDCVQEVWAALVSHLRDFHLDARTGRFLSWLYTLVHNQAIDLARQRTRHPTATLTTKAEAALRAPDGDPAAEYEVRRQQALVLDLLNELRKQVPERSYRVVYLRWIEGQTVPEVAAALDLTPEQVWSREYRLKQKFRHLLDRIQQVPAHRSA